MYKGKTVCAFVANDAGEYAFKKLVEEGIIDQVITISKEKAERLGVSNYLDVKEYFSGSIYYAKKYNLRSQEDFEFFKTRSFDIGFILGWNRLIPENILKTFKIGVYGFHGSPFDLPKGRGRSPSIWSIALGFKEFKLHMFKADAGADSGEIIGVKVLKINETDDIKIFHYKTSIAVYELIKGTIDKIIEGEKGKQQIGTPVYFRKRTERDGKINWNLPTKMIYNLIRAITKPYPGAWTIYKGQKIRIWKAFPFSEELFEDKAPGTICAVFKDSFVVKTKDGSVIVTEWEPNYNFKEGEYFSNTL